MRSMQEYQRGVDWDTLTKAQQVFVMELLADDKFNATAAARKAGYAHPSVAAHKNMSSKKIKRILGVAQRERRELLGLKGDEVIQELVYCVHRDPIDLLDENGLINTTNIAKLPKRIRKTIDTIKQKVMYDVNGDVKGVEVELKMTPKLESIKVAMLHLGLMDGQGKDETVKALINWDDMLGEPEDLSDPVEIKLLEDKSKKK